MLLLFAFDFQDVCPVVWLAKKYVCLLLSRTQDLTEMFLEKCCFFLLRIEIQDCRPGLWFAKTFWSAACQVISLACHKCPSDDPNEVLLLFGAILNIRRLSWSLIGQEIINVIHRTTTCKVDSLTRNVSCSFQN
jgi:hypothetical protein